MLHAIQLSETVGRSTTCTCMELWLNGKRTTLPPAGHCGLKKLPKTRALSRAPAAGSQPFSRLIIIVGILVLFIVSDESPFIHQRQVPVLSQGQVRPGKSWIIARARSRLHRSNTTADDATSTIVTHRGSSRSFVELAGWIKRWNQPQLLRLGTGDPHRHTPEPIWAEDPMILRCWGKRKVDRQKAK